jgi:mannose-6-phosphate isomerase-like protein (cupin superfamily)
VATFYDDWLATGPEIEEKFKRSPMVCHDRDIPWVQTRQDAKVKLMVSNVLGFPTMGSNVLKAEIPVGWHTGKHRHGEEGIHILQGTGFMVLEGERFEFHKGTTIQIPYRSEHQLFNTGDEPVLYISGMCFDLEKYVQLARMEQLEDCGPNDPAVLETVPPEKSQYLERDGRRVAIHLGDAPTNAGEDPAAKLAANQYQHDKTYHLAVPRNGFKANTSVSVTHIFEEPAYHHSGRHKHLEAVLYVLEGEGFSEVGREEERWEAGDLLHVPPSMWEHEHYNDSQYPYRQLRIQFGIRFWFTDIWPEGYTSQRIYDEFGNPIIAGRIERVRERV